jgi:CubicO group peptidase (beta-lactamase class C family)
MAPALTAIAEELVVEDGVAPAAAVAVAYREGDAWHLESGAAGRLACSSHAPLTEDCLFDLASVTKPLVAAALVRSSQNGPLSLACPLGQLLPCVRSTPAERCSLEQLLSHRAGLKAHVPLYAPLASGRAFDRSAALREAAQAMRSECAGAAPGAEQPPLYSDLGYVLAGAAAEHVSSEPLDALLLKHVVNPLNLRVGSARQCLREDPQFFARVVPTEVVPWRGGELAGVVHDDNAWALAGHGLSGQAGLFGTAAAIARFGAAVLDALAGRDERWLDRAAATFLCRARPGGTLRAGFDGKAILGSSAGERAGPLTFGHLGFTGTSFWCDPERDCVTVLLTNRVRFGAERERIRSARPRVHDALFTWAGGKRDRI